MAHEPMSPEEYKHHVKDVYVTTVILSVITIVEVVLAVFYEKYFIDARDFPRLPLRIFVVLASIMKAYWIMAVFMHVKHETKGFIYSILIPTLFLVWAIIAFSWEGASWSDMRDMFGNY
ncbi:MAG: cytochrome C oxidase subunit IV family protein [Chitinophagales bacterium]|nr:cytochrome C oxidase subunit IV family protein [Chitinophagales bacterium]